MSLQTQTADTLGDQAERDILLAALRNRARQVTVRTIAMFEMISEAARVDAFEPGELSSWRQLAERLDEDGRELDRLIWEMSDVRPE